MVSHTSTTAAKRVRLDRVCAEAVELARSAAEEAGEGVGDYIGAEPDADRVVSHYFECTLPNYRGWRWVTVLMRAPRSRNVTVAETALLPGSDALIAPQWVPWSERLRAGDVGVGDLLPTEESDERLMPAYVLSDDDGVEDIAFELGVGRSRVMSREGRTECAERWYEGPQGPNADIAKSAPADAQCGTCGFYLPLAGSLRQLFGVCGNVYAADDASVVSADHGCGAHSEVLNRDGDVKPKVVEEGNTLLDDSSVDPVADSSESGKATATEDSQGNTSAEVDADEAKSSTAVDGSTPDAEQASPATDVEQAVSAGDAHDAEHAATDTTAAAADAESVGNPSGSGEAVTESTGTNTDTDATGSANEVDARSGQVESSAAVDESTSDIGQVATDAEGSARNADDTADQAQSEETTPVEAQARSEQVETDAASGSGTSNTEDAAKPDGDSV